ncbi:MAG TPA: AraC family transcriptional regulator, partial [Kofleriaceae bacterium]|nr:AraC family transcriptional regulator [Kofleriaceae bacterium]
VELEVGERGVAIDRARFAVVPGKARHRVRAARGASACIVTIVIGAGAWKLVAREYGAFVDERIYAKIVGETRVFARTRWVDELVQRYVFERDVCEKHASRAARFLETELVKEVFFLGREQLERHTRSSVLFEGGALATRARAWLEEHLFEEVSTAALAKQCGASESTVLRAFRREIGVAPAIYVRRRRLEEARHLLETGRYQVTEVAARVGYDNPSAFAVAFRAQFGVSPSRVRPEVASLPAYGEPPRRPRRRG